MKAFKRKLRSRGGASITFALLLFLVCSIISSVVIVAGTASSGQLSRMAQTDQRYYAVTSAAELLKKVLEGQSVKIVSETEKGYEATSSNGVNYTPTQNSEKVTTSVHFNATIYTNTLSNTAETGFGNSLPIIQIEKPPLLVDAACRTEPKVNYSVGSDTADTTTGIYKRDLKLSVSNTSGTISTNEADAMAVDVQEQLSQDGTLRLYVYKEASAEQSAEGAEGETASNDRAYTLLLTFKPVVDESANTRKVSGVPSYTAPAAGSAGQYKRTDTETTTTTTVYTWKLTGIQKAAKPAAVT